MRRRDALPDPEVERGLRELEAALAGEPTADPDLVALVADVDAARPEPSAAFLASLDARVHAGFPREDETPARRAPSPWHARLRRPQVLVPSVGGTLAAALVVVVIASSGGGTDNDVSSSASSAPAEQSTTELVAPSAADSSASAGGAASPAPTTAAQKTKTSSTAPQGSPMPSVPLPSISQNRKVQRAAELTLTPSPGDVQDTADGVVRETQAAGGYVQQSSVATRDDGGTASFTLRIPSAHLDDALAGLSKLAHVGALNQSASDITAETASAADQLSDARAERQALLRALGRATTDRQIASLKARLRDNRSEIAQRKGALDAQRRRADLATVAVNVQGTGQADSGDGGGAWTPRDALHDAGRVLEVAGGVALIALAILAPLAILALLALLAARGLRRHRRETALDRSA
ncbi:hypothetical protein DSM104299_05587 [Baekduia alba]|uniref:DUF4349 domain-containing protein n=1 Tax=Baekduia alba TaxID=2997333 RepID=UPI0023416148|nr:DUF4349 domain-containing protein [Baekduia alba]WCB96819.1 hypothetical protein DSM104299_05587 [Baekduia alba]